MARDHAAAITDQVRRDLVASDTPTESAPSRHMRGRFARGERGAALVEMAMILPVIIMLLFGIIEMSWLFAQANDVRHGAREGARLAAVDFGDASDIGAQVCDRMDIGDAAVVVTFSDGSAGADDGARSSVGRIQVTLTPQSLTGMFDGLIGDKTISSDIDFILEQPFVPEASWWNDGAGGTYTCT